MRLAASVPGGMVGKCAFRISPSHQRSSAPRLEPMQIATMDFHNTGALVPYGARPVQWFEYSRPGAEAHPGQHDYERTRMTHDLRWGVGLALLVLCCGGCTRQSAQQAADARLQ